MAMLGATLYVADIDTIVGIDAATGARVLEVKSPNENPFLNDLAVEGPDTLLVTDTAANALYRVRLSDGSMSLLAGDMPGANGVAVTADGAHAIVVTVGANFSGGGLFLVSLRDGAVRPLGQAHGLHDGVAALPGGDFTVSDWVTLDGAPGAVRRFRADGQPAGDIALPLPMRGPADFAYDGAAGEIWIPRMLDGAVSVIPLEGGS
jgi:sugar lactone lactonase YvrE